MGYRHKNACKPSKLIKRSQKVSWSKSLSATYHFHLGVLKRLTNLQVIFTFTQLYVRYVSTFLPLLPALQAAAILFSSTWWTNQVSWEHWSVHTTTLPIQLRSSYMTQMDFLMHAVIKQVNLSILEKSSLSGKVLLQIKLFLIPPKLSKKISFYIMF